MRGRFKSGLTAPGLVNMMTRKAAKVSFNEQFRCKIPQTPLIFISSFKSVTNMKRLPVLLLAFLPLLVLAQGKPKPKKYQSLLWEISGNNLAKPSYLFGTMHVSSKLAFHLADSFYLGIRSANVVALETNPESWQEDMSKYDTDGENESGPGRFAGIAATPNEFLSINTLKFYKYDKKIERSLYSSPSTINNLLYRSFGNETSDFEEDTYLDMYIYQCGKKWGKKVTGVEKYAESMKLMKEAYRDASKDKNRKDRNVDIDEDYSMDKLQEAYRKGNLDQLDSINKLNSFSAAFDEKFMYRRNELQANSIDSILKSKSTLFVGVGAAHLPGERGVIELLRAMGYKLRPVQMGERDSHHKDEVEKVRVPVTFNMETADDGLFKVSIPGKFYKFGDDAALDQRQYADMANGSYYMVTRVMTNAWMWGNNTNEVYNKIDSLLYENIPGKIITRKKINRNGYNGFDITNRTRRGDVQRYNIFVTPFEIIFFKMGGTGDYVRIGEEANRFFNSIQFREYKPAEASLTSWKKYSPPYGGFSVDLPHEPYIGNDGSWIFDAEDKNANTQYRVIRSDIHNYNFVEEDSFDLSLMEESFAASEFIDTQLSRHLTNVKGYPALDAKFRDKQGQFYVTRFIVQGPHYYTLVAHAKQETAAMQNFFNSFEFKPLFYGVSKLRTDSSLYYTVQSPVFPDKQKEKLDMGRANYNSDDDDDDDDDDNTELLSGMYKSSVISNDTTGEKIFVSFYSSPRYYYSKDSTMVTKGFDYALATDTNWIIRSHTRSELPNHMKVWESKISEKGSSRIIWIKRYYKEGVGFALTSESDSLSGPSPFIKGFYETFAPADTLTGSNPFTKKSNLFFSDFFSADSTVHKRALKNLSLVTLDSSDMPQLKQAISSIDWSHKKYLDVKKSLIRKFDDIKTRESANYVKGLYYAAGDTVELQSAALETLLQQQTQYAFNAFRDIMMAEPPVIDAPTPSYNYLYSQAARYYTEGSGYDNGSFMDELNDSLELTRTILPDMLPLLNLDDYKSPMMRLLARMADSGLVKASDYEAYYNKFYLEAKQELKKQAIAEKKKAIERAEESKTDKKKSSYPDSRQDDSGNDRLSLYARLLIPFWEQHPNVQPVIQQLMSSNDNQLKYSTLMLVIRNKRPYNDSLLTYFAGMDEYRIRLYRSLNNSKQLKLFPAKYNNHVDLAKSALLAGREYNKPDTIAYLQRLPVKYQDMDGYVYFFKFKLKKDDANWRIALVGPVQLSEDRFDFERKKYPVSTAIPGWHTGGFGTVVTDLTTFLDVKLKDEEPVIDQLKKELKKQLYSKRRSAARFYADDDNDRVSLDNFRLR
jgi:uncharacterized protein YbaP (TraB family)